MSLLSDTRAGAHTRCRTRTYIAWELWKIIIPSVTIFANDSTSVLLKRRTDMQNIIVTLFAQHHWTLNRTRQPNERTLQQVSGCFQMWYGNNVIFLNNLHVYFHRFVVLFVLWIQRVPSTYYFSCSLVWSLEINQPEWTDFFVTPWLKWYDVFAIYLVSDI